MTKRSIKRKTYRRKRTHEIRRRTRKTKRITRKTKRRTRKTKRITRKTKRRYKGRSYKKKRLRGGAFDDVLKRFYSDAEYLYSFIFLGTNQAKTEVKVKNMRGHEYKIKDYGFRCFDMKNSGEGTGTDMVQLMFDRFTIGDPPDRTDLDTVINFLKQTLLEEIFPEKNIQGDPDDKILWDVGGTKVHLLNCGYVFRNTAHGKKSGTKSFPNLHCDIKIKMGEKFNDFVGRISNPGGKAGKAQVESLDLSDEYLHTLKGDGGGENFCLLNIWVNLTGDLLVSTNLMFMDKRQVPPKGGTCIYGSAILAKDIPEFDREDIYHTCDRLTFGETYLFQSAWCPHSALDYTRNSELAETYKFKAGRDAAAAAATVAAEAAAAGIDGLTKGSQYARQERKSIEFRFAFKMDDAEMFRAHLGQHYFEESTPEHLDSFDQARVLYEEAAKAKAKAKAKAEQKKIEEEKAEQEKIEKAEQEKIEKAEKIKKDARVEQIKIRDKRLDDREEEAKTGGGHCSGLVSVQYGGKGKFEESWLSLAPGVPWPGTGLRYPSLTFRVGSRDGNVTRTADTGGCTVGIPKKARKGYEIAFRLDLKSEDTEGVSKYIVAVDSQEELHRWMESLGTYSAEGQQAKLDATMTDKDGFTVNPFADEI
jgi:hypothetical protein